VNALARMGRAGAPIAVLGWGLNLVALAVLVIVTTLLLYAVFRRRSGEARLSEAGESRALRWIGGGAVAASCILVAMFAWTLHALTAYDRGLRGPALTIHLTGYRYWWKLEYRRPDGAVDFVTANEVHIPTGQAVVLLLDGGDVIHSFWVPALAGKTDLVPGQTNRMWIEADAPGLYRGACAEFCGAEHALMLIEVLAQPPAEFARWEVEQRTPAADTSSVSLTIFRAHGCAACHTVSGTDARGNVGPDLSHVGSRETLAAGIIPNNPGALARWLADPQSVKPGSMMPDTQLRGAELSDLVRYLTRLK
jgi:cytochrome c oxidase subunit 2